IPNLAMDLIVPPIATSLGIIVASKLFLTAIILLLVTGPFAIQRALFGTLSAWPLASFLFVYNWIFMYGFTNYLFGLGLALWSIAAWIALRDSRPAFRLATAVLLTLAIFVSHLHALGVYGLAILCFEAWRWRERGVARGARLFWDVVVF